NYSLSCTTFESRIRSKSEMNSDITASKKYTIVSTASVSFQSSKRSRFIDDRLHTKDHSSLFGNIISLLCVRQYSLGTDRSLMNCCISLCRADYIISPKGSHRFGYACSLLSFEIVVRDLAGEGYE